MDANIAINWLDNTKMVAKTFQLMFVARKKSCEKEMSFVGKTVKYFSTFELLGITFGKNLNFKIILRIVAAKQVTK